jgi:FAD/FMN-containing dehydrogenase
MGALAQEATAIDYDAIRQAIYAAPGRVNFGLHMNFKASPGERAAGVDAFLDRGRRRLGDHAVVPYRAGRDWRATDIDPGYVRAMQAVGRALDPDNLLNPGVGLIP